ncbi:MAG: hypothetical protein V3R98_05425 [Alphaproteobacteria bacterium]
MTSAATKIPALLTNMGKSGLSIIPRAPVVAAALLMTVASTATAGTTKEFWNRPAGPDNTSQVTGAAACNRDSSSAVACWNDGERDSLSGSTTTTQANDVRTDTGGGRTVENGDGRSDTEGGSNQDTGGEGTDTGPN